MRTTKILQRLLLLLLLLTAGIGKTWGQLTEGLTISGYESYNKTFYNFRTNTPTVLPTSGDLRYREDYGLHNYGSGRRSAIVSIPVAAGDLLVLQEYSTDYPTTINRGTKNDALSATIGYPCFNITEDAENVTFTTPRYGGVVAVLVLSQKYYYIVNASNGSDITKTLASGWVSIGNSVTIAYPQYILSGNTLYNIVNNGSGDWFKRTFTPNVNMYTETLNYTNGTVSNVVYYKETEDIPGVLQATNDARASQGKMGYTNNASTYVNTTNLNNGAYNISWRGLNGKAASRQVSFKAGDTEVYSFGITNGTNQLGTSGNIQIANSSMLSFSCEGSSISGLDWFYIQAVFAYKATNSTIEYNSENYRPDLFLPDYDESAYTFTSDNKGVATVDWNGIDAHHNGTATITAKRTIDGVEYYTTHTVTVTGEPEATYSFTYDETNKKEDFAISGTGGLPEYSDGTTFNIGFGNTNEVQAAINNLAHCEDVGGYWHAHLSNGNYGVPDMGTYYIIRPKLGYNGQISIYALVGDDRGTRNGIRLTDDQGNSIFHVTSISDSWTTYNLAAELIGGRTYYLFAETGAMAGALNSAYSNLQLQKVTFTQSPYINTSEVIKIPASGFYTITNGTGMSSPSYEIVNYYGDLNTTRPTINNNTGTLSNLTAGGTLLIALTYNGYTAYHLLTVAYPATDYPGHLWNFNVENEPMTTADVLRTVPVPPTTALGNSGDTWNARYKVETGDYTRAPEWRLNRAINGDNVLVVPETAGLLFSTGNQGFYMRNDDETFRHIGIHSYGASFTIPLLEAGDIVELNWKHDAGNNGSTFSATNLKDLRNKTIPTDDTFLITESAYRTQYNHPGRYSFIVAADGDVTFTLKDAGYTDILSVRIYKGPYHSTMHNIDLSGGEMAPTEVLLDNSEREFTYDYCNPLYSTATGPAMYVIKGYEAGKGFNHGVDADRRGNSDPNDLNWYDDPDGYPIDDPVELARLIDLRKNLVGLKVENHPWKSNNNAYNNGYIAATSGWGKVTIRMNNYTNDMKYVIGYTPDYTVNFGSAPHQTYPYTWDFTQISAQAERGASTNVYNTIMTGDYYNTNWDYTSGTGIFTLNTENNGPLNSQYVSGAVLVATEKSLSNFRGASSDIYALDEFDGLGFNGRISFDSDSKASSSRRHSQRRASSSITLLSLMMNNYKIVNTSTVEDDETIVTDWKNDVGIYLPAGNGWVKFGMDKIEETAVASCGFGYKCDREASSGNGIYLRPARSLKIGDVIVIKAYCTSTPTDLKHFGIGIYSDGGTTPLSAQYIPNGTKNVEVELTYDVTDENGLVDKDLICLYREDNSIYLTEVIITGDANAEPARREIVCQTATTITVPDLNALDTDGVTRKQDWIYVSASEAPTEVANATLVSSGMDGPDANSNNNVYKCKVTSPGNAYLTFPMNTRIYKIGVTHLLKEIHPVGGIGWATEIRNQNIDHELIGYFTKNDVNAYKVKFDSYDLNTATVALTPINEDGYVSAKTGIVMKLDNTSGLSDANAGKYVPLFYPSYTRPVSSTPTDFPANNLMYNVDAGIDNNNQNYNEQLFNFNGSGVDYTKFILTNIHWTYDINHTLNTDESAAYKEEDAAGFYRLHIWKTLSDEENAAKNTMPAHNAFLLVPTDYLPLAVWSQQSIASARQNTIGIRTAWGEEVTAIDEVEVSPDIVTGEENTAEGDVWYTLSGMKLPKRPTKSGLYICNGKKVAVHDSCP